MRATDTPRLVPTRRRFIQCGLAASALTACPLAARAAEAARVGEWYRPFRVLFDHTSIEGARFGAEATRLGATARAVGNGMANVWMQEIEPRWRRDPVPIAGLTSGALLFCFELLARDYGLGTVYRARHLRWTGARLSHVIEGPGTLTNWERRMVAAGEGWTTHAAALAMSCPAVLQPRLETELVDLAARCHGGFASCRAGTSADGCRAGTLADCCRAGTLADCCSAGALAPASQTADTDTLLFSWVIAPAVHAAVLRAR